MIKLIVSDMDGTLLDSNSKLPPNFFNTLDKLKAKNIKFVIASGRSYCTLRQDFCSNADEMDFISDNGTCIIENGEVTYYNILNRQDVEQINDVCSNLESVNLVLCGRKNAHVVTKSPQSLYEVEKFYKSGFKIADLRNLNDDIYKIGVCDLKGAATNSYPILDQKFSDRLSVVLSGELWTDIMNKGVNKGTALKKLQEKLNITPEETMAFGDYYNDLEMFDRAKYSFAMKNANEDIKKYTNFVADTNDNYGVIKAINEYVLK